MITYIVDPDIHINSIRVRELLLIFQSTLLQKEPFDIRSRTFLFHVPEYISYGSYGRVACYLAYLSRR